MRPIGATRETDEDVVDARELALAEQAQLAAHLCEATLAVIVAGADVWGWSSGLLGAGARARGEALARALAGEDLLVVPDVQASPRLRGEPAVVGPPPLRFVTAVRISAADGAPLGTLCIAGVRVHEVGAEHRLALRVIARQAGRLIAQVSARAPAPDRADELADFVDNAPVGLHAVEPDGRFRWINRTELRWLGHTREEVVGRLRVHDLVAPERLDAFRADFARLTAGELTAVETVLRRRDGTALPVLLCANALRDEAGAPLRSRAVVLDRSALPEPARADGGRAARTLEQVRLALGAAEVIVWYWDVLTNTVVWHELARLAGTTEPALDLTADGVARWVHPDDLPGVAAAFDRARSARTAVQHHFRIVRPDGAIRWLWARGEPRVDADGEVVSLSGAVRDVTDERIDRDAIAAGERRLTEVVESISDGFIALDPALCVTYVNRRAGQQLGRVAAELLGKPLWSELPELIGTPFHDAVERAHADGVAIELEHPGPDQVRWFLSRIYPRSEGGLSVFFADVTEQRAARESQAQTNRQLRLLSERLIAVREEEAARLAREIHDGLGQTLTALKLDLAWLGARPSVDPADLTVARKLRAMTGLVDDLFAAIRRMASELRPRMLEDLGLAAAIEWQVGDFATRSRLLCELDLGDDLDVPKDAAIALYRVLQEGLANIARHAAATRLAIRLRRDGDHAVLELTDDGRGTTPDQLDAPTSIGILGMRERMALVGGTLDVRGAPGCGTTVIARAPLA